ncbi:MAG: PIG-L family deacetylase [Endomicrobiales bacterium]|nr:PIG-L family deacetylase [Endomicrobiales bacterium]
MNILAIGPHPDDLEYGCGGTLYKLAKAKHKINILVMTQGDMGGDKDIRKKEQMQVAKILKAKLFWGDFADTQVPLEKQTINLIESYIKLLKPNLIFTPFSKDTHQDHRNISQATITATRYIRNVLFYEVPTSVNFSPASVFVNIGPVINRKLQLLKTHKSQVFSTRVANLTILESAKATALFRGFQNRVKYAEAFVPLRLTLDFFYELK